MSDKTVSALAVGIAQEGQCVDQLAEGIPAHGSVDHLRPPGYIWVGTGWMHRKLTLEGLHTTNPGVWRIRERFLTPPEAWWPPGPRYRASKG